MNLFVHHPEKRPLRTGKIWCSLFAIAGSALGHGFAQAQNAELQLPLQPDVKETCSVSPKKFASWFESGKVSLNGAVKPADSVDFSNDSNCSFYRWSQQMFLWLTSSREGRLVFDSPVFYDVRPVNDTHTEWEYVPHDDKKEFHRSINVHSSQVGAHGLQTMIDTRGKIFEVVPAPLSSNGKSMIENASGKLIEVNRVVPVENGKLTFLGRDAKKISVPTEPKLNTTGVLQQVPQLRNLSSNEASTLVQQFKSGQDVFFMDVNGNKVDPSQGPGQAGGGGVLMAKPGSPDQKYGSLVYYATIVNDVFAYFQTGTKNKDIPAPADTPASASFPTTQKDLDKIVTYAYANGKTIPPSNANALAIEIKTAWIEASAVPVSDRSKYITTTAEVPAYDQGHPQKWAQNGKRNVELILVGMHVVGSVKGHPEMNWATYEHFDNAPWSTFTYIDNKSQAKTITQGTDPSRKWLLSSSNDPKATYNVQRMAMGDPNEQQTPTAIYASGIYDIGPSNTIRWKTWGSASDVDTTSPNAIEANTDVMSINNSVISQLMADDVRAQYMLVGSTWTERGAAPTPQEKGKPPSNQVGTNQLANSTMETYKQGTGHSGFGSNCFSCHQTNTVGVSHIFLKLKPLFQK